MRCFCGLTFSFSKGASRNSTFAAPHLVHRDTLAEVTNSGSARRDREERCRASASEARRLRFAGAGPGFAHRGGRLRRLGAALFGGLRDALNFHACNASSIHLHNAEAISAVFETFAAPWNESELVQHKSSHRREIGRA